MTKDQKLETIRQACIKANPSIMELGFGCEVKGKKTGKIYRACSVIDYVNTTHLDIYSTEDKHGLSVKPDDFEILGRPIRLADVMYAICHSQKTRQAMLWGVSGVPYWWDRERLTDTGVAWNLLKDDLRDQSEETITFLAELLK